MSILQLLAAIALWCGAPTNWQYNINDVRTCRIHLLNCVGDKKTEEHIKTCFVNEKL
jgi:hypothetical protein